MNDDDLAELLRATLAQAGVDVPGVAVGLTVGGHRSTACAGQTNVDHPLPINSQTAFQIGSITKTWTAAALLRLAEHGALDIDSPVAEVLPQLELSDPAATETLTPRHLLAHTGGFEGDHFLNTRADFGRDRALAAVVAAMKQSPSLARPGTVSSYCNAGFYVLGRVIEVVTGTTFGEAIDELLIRPLGLANTSFFADELLTHSVAAGHAGTPPRVVRPWYRPHFAWPAGALVSSVADQLTWAEVHLEGGRGILEPETVALMRQPQAFDNTLGDAIGMPWILHDLDNRRVVEHGGSTNGFRAQLTLLPESSMAWVILANADAAAPVVTSLDRALRREVAGLRLDPRPTFTVPPEDLNEYVGTYGVPEAPEIQVTAGIGELVVSTGGVRILFAGAGRRDEFLALEPHVYRGRRGLARRDERGAVSSLAFGGRVHPRR